MPSLRRSLSSPSVRSSPYLATRARPNPRRPSPSATADRRVLADIEWWLVCDGQCHPDEHRDLDPDVPPAGSLTLSAGGGFLEPPLEDVYLSIAPHSPPGSPHGRDSSVESTPELHTTPLETVQLGLASPLSSPLSDLYPSSLARAGGRPPLFGLRSVSAPGLSHQGTFTPDFADIGGDSFSLDQNLFR